LVDPVPDEVEPPVLLEPLSEDESVDDEVTDELPPDVLPVPAPDDEAEPWLLAEDPPGLDEEDPPWLEDEEDPPWLDEEPPLEEDPPLLDEPDPPPPEPECGWANASAALAPPASRAMLINPEAAASRRYKVTRNSPPCWLEPPYRTAVPSRRVCCSVNWKLAEIRG
jgi:hypothetical protein